MWAAMVVAIGLFCAAGCMVGPDPATPAVRMPAAWNGALAPDSTPISVPTSRASATTTAPLDIVSYWHKFNDPELDSLIERAVNQNLNLKYATAQIRAARASRGIAASSLFPNLAQAATYKRSFSGTGSTVTGGASSTVIGKSRNPTDFFQYGLDASWEVDVFGGQRRTVEAADLLVLSEVWNRRDVLITLLSEVATDYITLRGYQSQIAIARQNLEAQQRTADLTRRRQRGGFQTGLDVANADATVASTLSSILPLEQQAQQTIYALSLLLSVPPATLQSELSPTISIPLIPPEVPIGLPSELLRRRPDVRSAELLLQQQTAQVGAAIANLYPSFSLTGSGGTQGNRFGYLGEWSTRFWSFGPTINWPILDFGSVRSNIELQRSQEEQALYTWQETVIQSLTDVENALVAYTKEQQHREALAEAVVANKKAVELSTLLYSNGQTDFLNVLVAEQSLFNSQNSLVLSNTTLATNLVALYKALGGGWEGRDPPPPVTTPPTLPTLNIPDLLDLTQLPKLSSGPHGS
jgi:NodT family efflux transporter outer membrane factor (OMF) lipoprotein